MAAGAHDMADALAIRAAERPEAPALVLLPPGDGPPETTTYAALHARALAAAAGLRCRLPAGARVLVAFPAGAEFVVALFACFLAGMIAVPAPPLRGTRRPARLAAVAHDCSAALVLMADAAARATGLPSATLADISAGDSAPLPSRAPNDVALLQYTSGSTGAPRGVALTHAAIWHNQSVIRTCFDHAEGVVLVGWLPNFHDMGLIGNLLQPIYAGGLSVMMSPTAFTQRPMRWLQAVSDWRAHTSGAPNFAYDLCVRAATDAACAGLDLSHWRVAFNGAEPIRAATLDAFAARFAPCGFRRASLMACYGLAESTLMVTGAPVDAAPVVLHAAKGALAEGALRRAEDGEAAAPLVACGDAVAGAEVIVADPETGARREDGAVGEVLVCSPSVCNGYWGNPAATAEAFRLRDGRRFLRTGDLGAMLDGRLYIVGRAKDVLIMHGRNIHPADVEAAVEARVAAAGAVRSVLAGVQGAGGETAVLFLELTRDGLRGCDPAAIAQGARACAMGAADTPLAGVVLLKPGALPLTSSGKVRRAACMEMFLAGDLPGIAWMDPGAERLFAAKSGAEAAGTGVRLARPADPR